jgi:hypothetical protein
VIDGNCPCVAILLVDAAFLLSSVELLLDAPNVLPGYRSRLGASLLRRTAFQLL